MVLRYGVDVVFGSLGRRISLSGVVFADLLRRGILSQIPSHQCLHHGVVLLCVYARPPAAGRMRVRGMVSKSSPILDSCEQASA